MSGPRNVSSVRVGFRGVEFPRELVTQFWVKEVFDPMCCLVEMVAGNIKMAFHVALP